MTAHETPQPSSYQFRELGIDECRLLLESKHVGRIVWCGANGPQALPVNYVLDIDKILFRTSPHSSIAAVARGQKVAFEVDEIDEFVQVGWSVLVVGTAEWVDDPAHLPHRLQDRPSPWAPGNRNLYVRVQPETITGRRVLGD